MKFAAEEVYGDHGITTRRLIMVTDQCESTSKYHDEYDYYLDVYCTKAEARAHFGNHQYIDETNGWPVIARNPA